MNLPNVAPTLSIRTIKDVICGATRSAVLTSACVCGFAGAAQAMPVLHPGDKIDIVVFNHPELSSTVVIGGDGSISLPVAGVVSSSGIGPERLGERIQARFAPYVKNVSVRVALEAQSTTIFIAGGPSGVFPYQPGESLVSVLDRLQYTPTSRPDRQQVIPHEVTGYAEQVTAAPLDLFDGPVDYTRVSLERDGKTLGPFDLVALRNAGRRGPALLPDDTITLVNKPVAVSVRGEVSQPGTAYLNVGDPLTRAIDQVGGTSITGSQTDITLIRGGSAQIVSLGSPIFSAPAVAGDQISVARAPRIDVLGTVVKPGEEYLRGNQTLVSAIYYAGGPDRYANLKAVSVLHDGVKTEYNLARLQKGHGGDNPPLHDGDVVFVPQGSTIDAATIFQGIGAVGSLGYLIYR